jgi:ribosome-binding factor A
LREVVADGIERMADGDERLRLVTVTAVEVTPDLSHATVYLSSLSEPAAEALAAQRVQLQASIGRQVRMKRTPHLEFAPDPAVAHGRRVEEILRQLRARRAPSEVDHADDPAERSSDR